MDHLVPEIEVGNINPDNAQSEDKMSSVLSSNNVGHNLSDKLTPLLQLGEKSEQEQSQTPDDGFRRQQAFTQRDMELEEDGGRGEEMEIQIQDEGEDYGDIQFFHHKLLFQQHLNLNNQFGFMGMGTSVTSFGSQNGLVNNNPVDTFHIEECDDNGIIANNFSSENPFVFPDNVMEYGEQAQFFPGNCVGYLETILEETDEEFEEEEGCSGRHWWTADSDTDTDSVIRVDNSRQPHSNQSNVQSGTNLKSVNNVEDLSLQSTFRSSASSRPFELEDLHLLDQLDLAFEETLMEPRRRSGFAAFGHQFHFLDQPLEKQSKLYHFEDDKRFKLQRSASHDGETTVLSNPKDDFILPQTNPQTGESKEPLKKEGKNNGEILGNSESKETFGSSLSPSSSDSSEPHEVAEEDFFYSSPGSDDSEEGSSSSDDSEKKGRILAEFSLGQTANITGFNRSLGSGTGKARSRALDSSTLSSSGRLKSFRSFDSLNSLSGTELLFSKPDTFPSFQYIKEDVEPSSGSASGSPTSSSPPRCNLTSSTSTNDVPGAGSRTDVVEGDSESQSLPSHSVSAAFPLNTFNKIANKKHNSHSYSSSTSSSASSGMIIMSSENLSEDSGIGAEGGRNSGGINSNSNLSEKMNSESSISEEREQDQESESVSSSYITKPEFALNPLVFSSLSSCGSGSNCASINSVPSLNNSNHHDSSTSPSTEFSDENHGSVVDSDESEKWNGGESSPSAISNNSLSNFHQDVDKEQIGNLVWENNAEQQNDVTSSSSIQFQPKLPISINDHNSSESEPRVDPHNVPSSVATEPEHLPKADGLPINSLDKADTARRGISDTPDSLVPSNPDLAPNPCVTTRKEEEKNKNKDKSTNYNDNGSITLLPDLVSFQDRSAISSSSVGVQGDIVNKGTGTPLPSPSFSWLSHANETREQDQHQHPISINKQQHHHFDREQSLSESEFESTESTAELDHSIGVEEIVNVAQKPISSKRADTEYYDKGESRTALSVNGIQQKNVTIAGGHNTPCAGWANHSIDSSYAWAGGEHEPTKISLHHRHPKPLVVVEPNLDPHHPNPTHYAIGLEQQAQALGQQNENDDDSSECDIKPSKGSVYSATLSSKEDYSYSCGLDRYGRNKNKQYPITLSSDDEGSSDESDRLVRATPIDPFRVGVAQVKQFKLDSNILKKLLGDEILGLVGKEEEEEEEKLESEQYSYKEEKAILGQSNFGFFGCSSETHTRTASTSTQESVVSSSSSFPIPTQKLLHSKEGDNNGIPIGKKEKKGDHLHLHLEDIKCGIHPERFTVPLGVYSATVLALAPSLPSKRLVFLNERQDSSVAEKETEGEEQEKESFKRRKTNGDCTNISTVVDESAAAPPVVKQTHFPAGSDFVKSPYTMQVDTTNAPNGSERRSTSPVGVPIKAKTYGAHNEVEVVLVSRSSRTPSPSPGPTSSLKTFHPSTSSSLGDDGNYYDHHDHDPSSAEQAVKVPRTRVHFSPVVSEISWRESYIDQGSEVSGSQDDIIAKLAQQAGIMESEGNGGVCDSNSDSLVRPLQFEYNNGRDSNNDGRQHSPSPGKNPILVEKVQMRSSFLQGGEDEEEEDDDELERKLTMHLHLHHENPMDKDHMHEDDFLDSRKEAILFQTGISPSNKNYDLYEDVNVSIEPHNKVHGSTTLSMVPDLLSQCENAAQGQTHINVCIDEVRPSQSQSLNVLSKPPLKAKPLRSKSHSPTPKLSSEIPPPPPTLMMMNSDREEFNLGPPQQQIFPKMFAEESNGSGGTFSKLRGDSKNNSSSSLNKKQKSSRSFSLGRKSRESSKERESKDKEASTDNKHHPHDDPSKENKSSNKPGFFERLSKIRLSGSKPKKQKIHPKAEEGGVQPLKSQNTVNVNLNGSSNGKSKIPAQPILKKTSQTQQSPQVISSYQIPQPPEDHFEEQEPNESHQAFENILEEIAGIRSIKMRMDKSSDQLRTPTPEPIVKTPPKELRNFAKRKQFYTSTETQSSTSSPSPPVSPNNVRSMSDLDRKLSQFKEETSKTRVVVSKSHPDLELIEDMVRQQSLSPEPKKENETTPTSASVKSPPSKKSPKKSQMSETGQKNEREWYKLLKSAAEKYYYRGTNKDKDDKKAGSSDTPKTGTGIVETDLDTGASREMLDAELVDLDKNVPFYAVSTSEDVTGQITTISTSPPTSAKTRSLTNLSSARLPLSIAPIQYDDVDLAKGELNEFDERAKSYEFLLNDNQKSLSVPPENQLRTETRQLSEHELRVQRSLQRLNVPEWYKKHEASSRTSTLERPAVAQDKSKILSRRSEYGSAGGLAGGWPGLSAFKTTSMSSLQGSGRYSGSLNRSNFIRGRPATMSATGFSRESLAGSASVSHSPSAYDRCSFTYGIPFAMTRLGQGRLSNNSGTVTPTSTADSTASTTNSYVKKPYLGWRSQERLNALAAATGGDGNTAPKLSVYLPPEERMAVEVLRSKVPIRPPISDRPPLPKPPPRSAKTTLTTNSSIPPPSSSEDGKLNVHESIREVTKAINQFVAKGATKVTPPKPQPRKKPGKKAIWIESSFVGRKPAPAAGK